jgi:hypothetical protein
MFNCRSVRNDDEVEVHPFALLQNRPNRKETVVHQALIEALPNRKTFHIKASREGPFDLTRDGKSFQLCPKYLICSCVARQKPYSSSLFLLSDLL